MSRAATRRKPASPPPTGEIADRINRARCRSALKRIGDFESAIDKVSGLQLNFFASALEWFADVPTGEES